MYTSDWWWSVQVRSLHPNDIITDKRRQVSLESRQPGATIIPVIVSSDKTLLTLFRGKMAYPIYMTIGNIPKDIRRKPSRQAQILIGYIPTNKLEGITNKAARRRALANLFHGCMSNVLGPISCYGETGIAMMSGDGIWRRCHPIFAIFVGDYPEQALVTCTYNGRCPKCTVPPGRLGEYRLFPPHVQDAAIDAYLLADGDVHEFHQACREAGLKPVYHPFWETLPLSDIFLSITPDILHQMLQGMMKHLIKWLIGIFGPGEINARCRAMPPNHNILLFTKGITTLSRVSGHEHKKMCCVLLGLIVDLLVPGGRDSTRIVKAVRALLDFLYLAQYRCHTSDTIHRMHASLSTFHDNKAVFLDLEIREHFNFPKIHSLIHYASSIKLFGTTDNYNTEQSERLHIEFTKDAYRATNRKDEYPQMTAWLERREKVQRHAAVIDWRQQGYQERPQIKPFGPPRACVRNIKMTQHPSMKAVSFNNLSRCYGALEFQDMLADFIVRVNHPGVTSAAVLRARAANTHIPFCAVPVFHNIKFTENGNEILDSVHIRPEQKDSRGRIIPSRFDTVLVQSKDQGNKGNSNFISKSGSNWYSGHRVAQVRVVFTIPSRAIQKVSPSLDTTPPTHLAYVEWFSPLSATPDPKHLMYRVSRSMQNGRRCAGIIRVDSILCSVHLIPRFGPVTPRDWTSFTVLDQCHTFYLNPFTDSYSYLMIV
jgi:hypothetical protein